MTARFLAVGVLAAFVFPIGCSKDPASQAKRLVEVGNRYYQAGKYAQASIVYRRAIQKQPRYGEAYYWLGLTESKRNNNGAAIASLHRAFDLPGPGYDAYEPLAELLLRLLHLDRLAAKRVSKALTDLNVREEQRNPGSSICPAFAERSRCWRVNLTRRPNCSAWQ
jgi:tetratricopeptide (TPR) repeat protein